MIWVDNLSAIALASNPVLHARTKHIELDVHFVRDKVLAKEIELRHVPNLDQIADILTKPLSSQSYVRLRNKLGVVERSTLGLRGDIRSVSRKDHRVVVKEHDDEDHFVQSTTITNETVPTVLESVDGVCEGYMWNAGPQQDLERYRGSMCLIRLLDVFWIFLYVDIYIWIAPDIMFD